MSASKKVKTLTLDELDSQFNPVTKIPGKIRDALKKLGDHAMTASNFAKEARVPNSQLVNYVEEFADHVVTVRENGRDRTLWCGSKSFAEKVRERLGI